jgi:hypothetical protein
MVHDVDWEGETDVKQLVRSVCGRCTWGDLANAKLIWISVIRCNRGMLIEHCVSKELWGLSYEYLGLTKIKEWSQYNRKWTEKSIRRWADFLNNRASSPICDQTSRHSNVSAKNVQYCPTIYGSDWRRTITVESGFTNARTEEERRVAGIFNRVGTVRRSDWHNKRSSFHDLNRLLQTLMPYWHTHWLNNCRQTIRMGRNNSIPIWYTWI